MHATPWMASFRIVTRCVPTWCNSATVCKINASINPDKSRHFGPSWTKARLCYSRNTSAWMCTFELLRTVPTRRSTTPDRMPNSGNNGTRQLSGSIGKPLPPLKNDTTRSVIKHVLENKKSRAK
jgi:hypothetical protein